MSLLLYIPWKAAEPARDKVTQQIVEGKFWKPSIKVKTACDRIYGAVYYPDWPITEKTADGVVGVYKLPHETLASPEEVASFVKKFPTQQSVTQLFQCRDWDVQMSWLGAPMNTKCASFRISKFRLHTVRNTNSCSSVVTRRPDKRQCSSDEETNQTNKSEGDRQSKKPDHITGRISPVGTTLILEPRHVLSLQLSSSGTPSSPSPVSPTNLLSLPCILSLAFSLLSISFFSHSLALTIDTLETSESHRMGRMC